MAVTRSSARDGVGEGTTAAAVTAVGVDAGHVVGKYVASLQGDFGGVERVGVLGGNREDAGISKECAEHGEGGK